MTCKLIGFGALLSILSISAIADTVITEDGATLTGEITLINAGKIHLETTYAGTLEIDQSKVASFSTDQPVYVRLASGSTMSGPVQSTGNGTLKIQSEDGTLETDMARVTQSWMPSAEDPQLAELRMREEALQRKWKYEGALDVTGKTGNTEEFTVGARFDATLKGPQDELKFYGLYEKTETDGVTTDDRILGGTSYESFFSKHYGWYVRTELEKDTVDQIDLRSTSALGASFRVINKDIQTLVFRTGVGYRYTSYSNGTPNESSPTLDFGLNHWYQYKDVFEMDNSLTFVPSIREADQYRIVHDSGIEMPVANSESWKWRLGVRNEYDSQPAATEKLDTTYYSRLIYAWE